MAFLPKQKPKDVLLTDIGTVIGIDYGHGKDHTVVVTKVTNRPSDEEVDLMDRDLLKQWCVYFGYADENVKGKTIKELREMLRGL